MYTKQMADENKVMLEQAKKLWIILYSYELVSSFMLSEFGNIDEKRVLRWVNKAKRVSL